MAGNNISRKKPKAVRAKKLRRELTRLEAEGVDLRLNGRPDTPKNITRAHRVAEHGCYMRDYIPDEKGGVAEIHFQWIADEAN